MVKMKEGKKVKNKRYLFFIVPISLIIILFVTFIVYNIFFIRCRFCDQSNWVLEAPFYLKNFNISSIDGAGLELINWAGQNVLINSVEITSCGNSIAGTKTFIGETEITNGISNANINDNSSIIIRMICNPPLEFDESLKGNMTIFYYTENSQTPLESNGKFYIKRVIE
jgi:hypothetical protein